MARVLRARERAVVVGAEEPARVVVVQEVADGEAVELARGGAVGERVVRLDRKEAEPQRRAVEVRDDLRAPELVRLERELAVEARLAEEVAHPHPRRSLRARRGRDGEPRLDRRAGRDEVVGRGREQLRLCRRRREVRRLPALLELDRVHPHRAAGRPGAGAGGEVDYDRHRHRDVHHEDVALPVLLGIDPNHPSRDFRERRARGEVPDPRREAQVARLVALRVEAQHMAPRIGRNGMQRDPARRVEIAVVGAVLLPRQDPQRPRAVHALGVVGDPHRQVPALREIPGPDVDRPVEPQQAALERRVHEQVACARLRHPEILREAEVHAAALVLAGLRLHAPAQVEVDAVAVPPAHDLVRDPELDAPGKFEHVGRVARLARTRGDPELPRRVLPEERELELLVGLHPPDAVVLPGRVRQVHDLAVRGETAAFLSPLVGDRPLGAVGVEREQVGLGLRPGHLDHHEAVGQQLDALAERVVPGEVLQAERPLVDDRVPVAEHLAAALAEAVGRIRPEPLAGRLGLRVAEVLHREERRASLRERQLRVELDGEALRPRHDVVAVPARLDRHRLFRAAVLRRGQPAPHRGDRPRPASQRSSARHCDKRDSDKGLLHFVLPSLFPSDAPHPTTTRAATPERSPQINAILRNNQ